MKFDIVIANPPYGKIGNEITKAVVDNIDYGVFVNLLPSNDYRRFHKEDALYQYVDINSMKAVQGGFKDAAVTTMMCKVNKDRAYFISEAEFEIENYTNSKLRKYFYETYKRNHYALDTDKALIGINEIYSLSPETTFIIGHRDVAAGHMPRKKDGNQYKWNVEKSIDAKYLSEHLGKHRSNATDKTAYNAYNAAAITFKTAKEKDNFTNFVYGNPEFINAVFTAVHIDSYIKLGKVFPKVDWTRPQTVESILKDYGYTPSEIEEVVADLVNFKVMEKKGMRYDVIIANPPYGKIGNEITKAVVDNIDYGVFVNLLPSNDYRRFHKEDALYQYVDINSMRPVQGGFKDAAVTTMMCRVNKDRALYISEAEFEIENYKDKSLKRYFYENRKRNHYALDNAVSEVNVKKAETLSPDFDFVIGVRDLEKNHRMPYSKTGIAYIWNVEKSVDSKYLYDNYKHTVKGEVNTLHLSVASFKTKNEHDNFVDFVFGNPAFMLKVIRALQSDGYVNFGKVFPKVSWERKWTVQELLTDYGYTPSEIEEVVADLANFKGMEEK